MKKEDQARHQVKLTLDDRILKQLESYIERNYGRPVRRGDLQRAIEKCIFIALKKRKDDHAA